MRLVSIQHILCLLLCGAALPGCYQMYGPYGAAPYGAQPYGGQQPFYGGAQPYGAQPYGAPVYQPGIQTLQPGVPYVPGTVPQNNMGNPGTFEGNGTLQPIPQPNNGGSGLGNEVRVPEPYTQPGSPYMSAPMGMLTPEGEGVSPASAARYPVPNALPQGNALQPIPQRVADAEPANPFAAPISRNLAPQEPIGTLTPQPSDGFLTPQPASASTESVSPFAPVAPVAPAESSTPSQTEDLFGGFGVQKLAAIEYGHQSEYRWLQGVVNRGSDGSWSITFDDDPAPAAPYAGELPLANSPELAQISDGAVVRIEGEVDPVVKGPNGKPLYVISQLRVLGN